MLGLSEVPVIRLSLLDETVDRAYGIADNKLTEMGVSMKPRCSTRSRGCRPTTST